MPISMLNPETIPLQPGQWAWLLSLLHAAIAMAVILHCLRHRREPTSALLWIFLALAVPAIGGALYLLFGVNHVPEKAWKRRRRDQELMALRLGRGNEILPLAYLREIHAAEIEPDDPQILAFDKAMAAVVPETPLVAGNAVQMLIDGSEAYPAMLAAIEAATDHIHLQTFIFAADQIGRRFLDLLAAKAQQGVVVRVLYDRFGSTHAVLSGLFRRYRHIPNLHLVGWTQASLLKRQFQVNLRNHRKIMVIDGIHAFAGGLNLHDENVGSATTRAIRDYHFALHGPVVQELQYSFVGDWYFMTEQNPETLLSSRYFPHQGNCGSAMVRLISSGPSKEWDVIHDVLFTALSQAQHEIIVVTPYFAPTLDIVRAMRSAVFRGVRVRLVVPRHNNHFYVGLAGRALYEDLLVAGVRVFERRPPFIHAKAMLIDDTLALVGSANLDVRSLRLHYETNLAVYDSTFRNQLKQVLLEEIACSDEILLDKWRQRPRHQQLLENFCHLLTPIL